jgi:hypothetical protein
MGMKTISSAWAKVLIIGVLSLISLTASRGQSDQRAVVLPPGRAQQIAKGDGWQPTKEDIAGLEANLEQVSHMNDENRPANNAVHINRPELYFRQYVGIFQDGKKGIYVNAFCAAPPSYWRERLVEIYDGYTCVWQAVYDPSVKRFVSLRISFGLIAP